MGESLKAITSVRTGRVLRILVVDDNRAQAVLFKEVMTNLRCRYELHFVWDGVEALDFLHRRGVFADAPRPNLILLDINMPRLGGLETLSAIKSDPELYVIPVIMFSSSVSPEDVRESYQAHANCYMQKPDDLERCVKLVQVVESYWMDFGTLPACEERKGNRRQSADSNIASATWGVPSQPPPAGYPIAKQPGEARTRAMVEPAGTELSSAVKKHGCEEHNRLLSEFGIAVRELVALHEQQFQAIIERDNESSRFDLLIHMASEYKHRAKYAYLRHVESHGCSNLDADQTRT